MHKSRLMRHSITIVCAIIDESNMIAETSRTISAAVTTPAVKESSSYISVAKARSEIAAVAAIAAAEKLYNNTISNRESEGEEGGDVFAWQGETPFDHPHIRIPFIVLYSVVFAASILGNSK